MPMTQEQLLLTQGVTDANLYLGNLDQRLPRRNSRLGIVLREPDVAHGEPQRQFGSFKYPLDASNIQEARKKKKIVEEDLMQDDNSHNSHTSSALSRGNHNVLGEPSNTVYNRIETMPILNLDFVGQNLDSDQQALVYSATDYPHTNTSNPLIDQVGGLDPTLVDDTVAALNPNISDDIEHVPRLGPLSSQSSATRPHLNGVCVTRMVPIEALLYQIYNGGCGQRQLARIGDTLNDP